MTHKARRRQARRANLHRLEHGDLLALDDLVTHFHVQRNQRAWHRRHDVLWHRRNAATGLDGACTCVPPPPPPALAYYVW
jgi:hypothetical protein